MDDDLAKRRAELVAPTPKNLESLAAWLERREYIHPSVAQAVDNAAARIRELEAERDEAITQMVEAKAELVEVRGFYAKHSKTEHVLDRGTHVIVPVEPTEAMLNAGRGSALWHLHDQYRAMIKAAQGEQD